jgi:glycosyltransferase involved in cell wall biosynthesis
MKICLVANPYSAHTRRLAQGLIERGHSVSLVTEGRPPGPPATRQSLPEWLVEAPDLLVFDQFRQSLYGEPARFRKLRYLATSIKLPALLDRIKPDILHAVGAAGAAWLAATARFHPFLITATGSDLLLLGQRSRMHNFLTSQAIRQADRLLCISPQLCMAARSMKVPEHKLEINFLGVDTATFHPAQSKAELRQRLGLSGKFVILSLRAVKAVYNPLIIAQAIPQVLNSLPQAHFLIMTYNADPQMLLKFQELVSVAGVSQSVEYLPPLEGDRAIAAYLQAADLAVSISASDGTPVSVLESMACGCPLILGELPTLHDWVESEVNGVFVPQADDLALSQAILRLAEDETLRARLGQAAAHTALQKADRESQFARLEEIYRRSCRDAKPLERTD